MSIELKIKAKHLALEPRIIRHEETKLKRQMKYHRSEDQTSAVDLEYKLHSLTNHRKIEVRNEARATHLARAYLKGKSCSYAELKRNPEREYYFQVYVLSRVHAMIRKYGTGDQRKIEMSDLKLWAKT